MRRLAVAAGVLAALAGCATPQGHYKSFGEAQARYNQARRLPGYDAYAAQFWKLNDNAHFDQNSGCYAKGEGPVNLLLVLDKTDPKGGAGKPLKIAIMETHTDVNTAKAKCFRKAYQGLATNIPPFLPFLLQATLN